MEYFNERVRTDPAEAQEIRCAVRRGRRQYRTMHGWPQRQRSALSRLRHPRFCWYLRVRGNRLPARARQIADAGATERLQGETEIAARHTHVGESSAGATAGVGASDGRDAHGGIGARLR